MEEKSQQFLEQLMHTPSPSGYEQKVRQVWREELTPYCDEVELDVHGNAIASLNKTRTPKIMLAGHIDELGFQVKYFNDKGFIYFGTLGGFDATIIPGRKVIIHAKTGPVLGVLGKKAIHLMDRSEENKTPKIHELYIDIGASSKDEVQKLMEIGDPITYEPNFATLRNDLQVSRGFDDKIGAFVVAEVMKKVAARKNELKAGLFGVATVQEEVGLRGARTSAWGIQPQIGIAIDVTHATDTPDTSAQKDGEVKLGAGAVIARGPFINPNVFDLLLQTAKSAKIPYQVEAIARNTGTDTDVIQTTGAGVASGLISIPLRYMHTYSEVISIQDVKHAIDLLAGFCLAVSAETNLIP